MTPSLFRMLDWHELIEAERRQPGARVFVSDYNGGHPFVEEFLGELADTAPGRLADITRYSGLDEDVRLRTKIAAMHQRYDGVDCAPRNVLPGGGSSSLLGTFATWLLLTGRRRIHYVPPVYYKLAYLFRRMGIEPVPVARGHAYQPDFDLRLPDERTVLVLTDPVWYAGRRVPSAVLKAIGDWQEETGSLVFVDGTFQYLRWDGERGEESAARLPGDLTLRMVCPTKYLSIHGYRCAHLLVPGHLREELAELHMNLHGDVAVSDRLFAHRAADLMLGEGNGALIRHVRDRHEALAGSGALSARMPAETGFFLFARPRVPHRWFLAMDGKYFELDGHPGYVRINLLNRSGVAALITAAGQSMGRRPAAGRPVKA
ncbi:aminotransferase class I/II-fold pyridoxal phosphate-dependent enzyme [Streptomyces huiliensis]|uniref:aminotransferase class I/II-fold pyridoxal phosphate-dependent enzyme n=1 Tax=Streptomyces huiliensis TaxID=2876027 RepID=UPI001CBAA174|nr:aminotransferase class I/II-fold pyridoxal phosphate-dependent enzyme [Streptomyces huiliensis]MBZ4318951.1 aminotransferase class I/II-fold pyridoxal phosphate-dependent enzyme [Streptomyces huiliensis]